MTRIAASMLNQPFPSYDIWRDAYTVLWREGFTQATRTKRNRKLKKLIIIIIQ